MENAEMCKMWIHEKLKTTKTKFAVDAVTLPHKEIAKLNEII